MVRGEWDEVVEARTLGIYNVYVCVVLTLQMSRSRSRGARRPIFLKFAIEALVILNLMCNLSWCLHESRPLASNSEIWNQAAAPVRRGDDLAQCLIVWKDGRVQMLY